MGDQPLLPLNLGRRHAPCRNLLFTTAGPSPRFASGPATHRGMAGPSRNGDTREEGASRRARRQSGRRPGPHHGPTGSRNEPVQAVHRGHPRRARIGVERGEARQDRRPAQPGGREASRAPRGGRQGRPQRRGDGHAAWCEHRREARRQAGAGRHGQEGSEVRRALPRDHRPRLRDPRRVREHPSSQLSRPGHRPRHSGSRRGSTARRSTRSPSPTARSTTRRSGSRTTTARTTRRRTSGTAPTSSPSRPTTRSSRPAATACPVR